MLLRSKANSASERGSFLRIFSALRFVAIRISLSLSFSLFLSSPRFTLEAREEDDEPRVLGISIERERERFWNVDWSFLALGRQRKERGGSLDAFHECRGGNN